MDEGKRNKAGGTSELPGSRPLFLAPLPTLICLGILLLLLLAGAYFFWQQANARPIDAQVYPLGANFFLEREVEQWKRERTVQLAREAGIRWAKQQFPWEELEPARGQYDWKKFDEVVSTYERFGLQIIARLDRPPRWTRRDNSIEQAPPDDFEDYANFVGAFVEHYRGRIHYLQIWNEPNIFPEWGAQPVDPTAYVTLLKLAHARAKTADPTIHILSAPLALTLGQPHPEAGKWISMNDVDYLDAMYRAGAQDYFDILSANGFGFAFPPEDPPSADKLNFQRVALERAVMEKYGDNQKAVWLNEYGWNAAPADMSPETLVWGRVSEAAQADYTVRGFELARQHWRWLGVINIWYLRQVGDVPPTRADYYFRMLDPDFTPREIYIKITAYASSRADKPP